MKVMSFNLRSDFILDFKNRWDKREHIVYEIIDKYDCDIIGVQEVTNKMFNDIKENFDDYTIVGKPRSKKYFSERNNLFIKNRNKIINHNTFWLSKNPEKVGSQLWYSLYPRICTTAIVELENGDKVRVYNTHLDCFLPQARDFGLKKLAQFIDKNGKKEKFKYIS